MAKRTPLSLRQLPDYTKGEEIMNMVTHIAGGALGAATLLLALLLTIPTREPLQIATGIIYGSSMIALYSVSSIYHGLHPSTGKKVLQVIDHCTIYFLIAGTYTPILVCAVVPVYPTLGWGLFAMEWGLAILAATLTAIDLQIYRTFSMICYIFMGWAIIFFLPQAIICLTTPGFFLTLAGGIVYTIGAVLYGIGNKQRWFHSIFHIFVVIGSLLQMLAIVLYVF